MSKLSRTFMVNGEFVEYVNPNSPQVEYICDCGASCPRTQCFERMRRRPYDSHEGHYGDE